MRGVRASHVETDRGSQRGRPLSRVCWVSRLVNVALFRCPSGLTALSRCRVKISFLISFLVATSRCLLLCLPLALLSTALSESAVPCLLLSCLYVLSVAFSCRIELPPHLELSCLFPWVVWLSTVSYICGRRCRIRGHTLLAVLCRYLLSISFLDIFPRCLATLFLAEFDIMHHASCIMHVSDVFDFIQSIRFSGTWFDTMSISSINKQAIYSIWLSGNLVLIVITIRVPESISEALPK